MYHKALFVLYNVETLLLFIRQMFCIAALWNSFPIFKEAAFELFSDFIFLCCENPIPKRKYQLYNSWYLLQCFHECTVVLLFYRCARNVKCFSYNFWIRYWEVLILLKWTIAISAKRFHYILVNFPQKIIIFT